MIVEVERLRCSSFKAYLLLFTSGDCIMLQNSQVVFICENYIDDITYKCHTILFITELVFCNNPKAQMLKHTF